MESIESHNGMENIVSADKEKCADNTAQKSNISPKKMNGAGDTSIPPSPVETLIHLESNGEDINGPLSTAETSINLENNGEDINVPLSTMETSINVENNGEDINGPLSTVETSINVESNGQDDDCVVLSSDADDLSQSVDLITCDTTDDSDTDSDIVITGMTGMDSEAQWRDLSEPLRMMRMLMDQQRDPASVLQELFHLDPSALPQHPRDQWQILLEIMAQPTPRSKLTTVNTMDDVLDLLQNCTRVVVLSGAGISVSCGIPDFRSRDGIYARLAVDFPDLANPQAMFDLEYFKSNPAPFFKFAKEIYPGQYKPSMGHRFIKALETRDKLLRNYTQNIDTLEQIAGITKAIQCHGSFATASCMVCKHQVTGESIKEDIMSQKVPRCPVCPESTELAILKPDIVFFGEDLPPSFHSTLASDKTEADLLIVMGSSLKVRPVSLIPDSLLQATPQILINREPLAGHDFDVELYGDCDVIIAELCRRLGWSEVLREHSSEISGEGKNSAAVASTSNTMSTVAADKNSSNIPSTSENTSIIAADKDSSAVPSTSEDTSIVAEDKDSSNVPSTSEDTSTVAADKESSTVPSTSENTSTVATDKDSSAVPSTSEGTSTVAADKDSSAVPSTSEGTSTVAIDKDSSTVPSKSEDTSIIAADKDSSAVPSTSENTFTHAADKDNPNVPSTSGKTSTNTADKEHIASTSCSFDGGKYNNGLLKEVVGESINAKPSIGSPTWNFANYLPKNTYAHFKPNMYVFKGAEFHLDSISSSSSSSSDSDSDSDMDDDDVIVTGESTAPILNSEGEDLVHCMVHCSDSEPEESDPVAGGRRADKRVVVIDDDNAGLMDEPCSSAKRLRQDDEVEDLEATCATRDI